jgi:hypothetical protein
MRYTSAEPDLIPLLDAAQREPVFIERDQKDIAVLVSARDYGRLVGAANQSFQDFCDSVSEKAAGQGLTESKLDELLNNA